MQKQDIVFLAVCIGTMLMGVMLPSLAEPMAWVPRVTMMSLLFMGFLSVDGREVWQNLFHFPAVVVFLVCFKLVVMPVACWAVFRLVLPEFALGALVIGGASTAVSAPFFALMVQADFVLVLVGLVCSSLLLPLTLPLLVAALHSLAPYEGSGAATLNLPVLAMMGNLAVTIVLPYVAAQTMRRCASRLTATALRFRTPIFFACVGLGNVAIFSQYSSVLTGSPQYVFLAIFAAFALCGLLFVLTSALTAWMPMEKQLAVTISCVAMNNILILILSVEFFSVTEALFAAMYTGPFCCSVVLFRLLRKFLQRRA